MICIDIKTWIDFSENNSQQCGMKKKMNDQNLRKIYSDLLDGWILKKKKKTAVRIFYLTFNNGNPSKQNNKKNAQKHKKRLIFDEKNCNKIWISIQW